MIGVPKNYLSLDILAEFVHMHTLDGARSAYGHKYRSFNISVVGIYDAGAGLAPGRRMLQSKFHIVCKVSVFARSMQKVI